MNNMRDQLTIELPEATYEEVTSVQQTLAYWVMRGILYLEDTDDNLIYRPRAEGNMLTVVRQDKEGNKSEDLYYQISEIRYPKNPTPNDLLVVSHFYYKRVTSQLSLRGISNLYIEK